MSDLISRQAAIDALCNGRCPKEGRWCDDGDCLPVKRIKSLPSVEPEQKIGRWIPVSEKPKEVGEYLVQTDTGYMCLARWTDINTFWPGSASEPHWNQFDVPQYSRVVAWRERPEFYREGEDVSDD